MQFVLTPLQFGVPNSRPRYYCIASRACDVGTMPGAHFPVQPSELFVQLSTNAAISGYHVEVGGAEGVASPTSSDHVDEAKGPQCPPAPPIHYSLPYGGRGQDGGHVGERGGGPDAGQTPPPPVACIGDYLLPQPPECLEDLLVPLAIMQKSSSWCFDIVSPDSVHSACFTKAYGRYVKGTGSVIMVGMEDGDGHSATSRSEIAKEDMSSVAVPSLPAGDTDSGGHAELDEHQPKRTKIEGPLPKGLDTGADVACEVQGHHEQQSGGGDCSLSSTSPGPSTTTGSGGNCDDNWEERCKTLKLRYFSPRELLNLFGFPAHEFEYPADIVHRRKMYELIGNSLNVIVAGSLLKFLFQS